MMASTTASAERTADSSSGTPSWAQEPQKKTVRTGWLLRAGGAGVDDGSLQWYSGEYGNRFWFEQGVPGLEYWGAALERKAVQITPGADKGPAQNRQLVRSLSRKE